MVQKTPVPTPCELRAVMLTTNYATEQILFSSSVSSLWKLFCSGLILYTIQSPAKISSLHYLPLNDCQGLNYWLGMSNLTVRPLCFSLWERDKHLVIFFFFVLDCSDWEAICSNMKSFTRRTVSKMRQNYNERKNSPQQLSSPTEPCLPMRNRKCCLMLVQMLASSYLPLQNLFFL